MKKSSRSLREMVTSSNGERWYVGIDLGDRWSHYWIEDAKGGLVESGKTKMTREALSEHFRASQLMRIAIETGTHSNWVRTHLAFLGHEVIVTNARELQATPEAIARAILKTLESWPCMCESIPGFFVRFNTGVWKRSMTWW